MIILNPGTRVEDIDESDYNNAATPVDSISNDPAPLS